MILDLLRMHSDETVASSLSLMKQTKKKKKKKKKGLFILLGSQSISLVKDIDHFKILVGNRADKTRLLSKVFLIARDGRKRKKNGLTKVVYSLKL